MLCGGHSDSMPVRLGQFYALVLLLLCLATNIAFFAEVREPFLGDDDPTASVKLAFSDLDIRAKIAEFYPKIQSPVDESEVDATKADDVPVADVTPPPPPAEEKTAPREPRQQPAPPASNPPPVPVIVAPIVDPFPPITPSPITQPPITPPPFAQPPTTLPPVVESEKAVPEEIPPNETAFPAAVTPERRGQNRQTAAIISGPAPVAAVVQPVIADQFKPITVEPKPVAPVAPAGPVKPSATPVWETVDTILDRPIRYD